MTSLARLKVVLASSSPRRHELLKLIGVDHEVIPAHADESHVPGEKPDAHAERLARTKSEAVATVRAESLVIGADTIVVVDQHILGKPRDLADAARMLRMLSNRSHVVMTAIAVTYGARTVSLVEKVTVSFRDLTEDEIARYIATGEPMDKAGAYGIQGYGATIVRRIEGDYFAVMGLSLVRLVELMAQLGVRYDFAR
ncbi:MAG: Maf family protein [Gemmatimonadaceae bacterium]